MITVRVEGDAAKQVELFDGRKISIEQYHELIARQHGEDSLKWDGDNAFSLAIATPMPFTEKELQPNNILNGPDLTSVSITNEMLQRMADDPDWFHVVCMMVRPGCYLFMRKLELEHYRPATPRNNLFYVTQIKWQEMEWTVISIPLKERHLADQVAKECGMAFEDGIPHVIGGPLGVARFPMNSERVFSLRNSANSIVYNGMAAAEMTREIELKAVEDVERRHSEWLKAQGL